MYVIQKTILNILLFSYNFIFGLLILLFNGHYSLINYCINNYENINEIYVYFSISILSIILNIITHGIYLYKEKRGLKHISFGSSIIICMIISYEYLHYLNNEKEKYIINVLYYYIGYILINIIIYLLLKYMNQKERNKEFIDIYNNLECENNYNRYDENAETDIDSDTEKINKYITHKEVLTKYK